MKSVHDDCWALESSGLMVLNTSSRLRPAIGSLPSRFHRSMTAITFCCRSPLSKFWLSALYTDVSGMAMPIFTLVAVTPRTGGPDDPAPVVAAWLVAAVWAAPDPPEAVVAPPAAPAGAPAAAAVAPVSAAAPV